MNRHSAKSRKKIIIDGASLTIEKFIEAALEKNCFVSCGSGILTKLAKSRSFYLTSGLSAYGDTVGVGDNVTKIIPPNKRIEFQKRIVDSLSCGAGCALPAAVSRGAMLLRANSLIKEGCSAIGADKVLRIVELLNADIVPIMREDGSVCASGDLIPLSSIAQLIRGRGEVWYKNVRRRARDVLREVGLEPLELREKEGLALVNGTSTTTALSALAYYDATYLTRVALVCEALAIEALRGSVDHLDPFVHRVKNHPGEQAAASSLRTLIKGSKLTTDSNTLQMLLKQEMGDSTEMKETSVELQDPYCIRCAAQIFGPTFETLMLVKRWIEAEMNSGNDNPIVNIKEQKIHHTGNFSGFYLAFGMDYLSLALFNIADLLHALKSRLLNEKYNRGLGASLAGESPGLNSGLKGIDILTTDLFGKICFLASPVSIHRSATESNNQDVVSFGFASAERAAELNEKFRRLLAAVLLVVTQAVDQRAGGPKKTRTKLAPNTRAVYDIIRAKASYLVSDRPLRQEIASIEKLLREHVIQAPKVTGV